MKALLWKHRDKISSVMIIATEPFIPWEIVHLKDPSKKSLPAETLFLGQFGAVRSLHGPPFPPKQLRVRKERAYTLVPKYVNPDDELPGALEDEKVVQDLFGAKPAPAHPNPVRDLLAGGKVDLLHFAGHGLAETDNIADAEILLEGRVEDGKFIDESISATTVQQFASFQGDDSNRPVIFLNACQIGRAGYQLTSIGGFANAFMCAGAGLFVGSLWSVGDDAASVFTREFYKQLCDNKTVADATKLAREKSRDAGEGTWLAYTVYGHPHARLKRS
jgi:CHAT domain-containing protein